MFEGRTSVEMEFNNLLPVKQVKNFSMADLEEGRKAEWKAAF